jgi:hypothetical protein
MRARLIIYYRETNARRGTKCLEKDREETRIMPSDEEEDTTVYTVGRRFPNR